MVRENIKKHKFDLIAIGLIIFLTPVVHWNLFFSLAGIPRIYPASNDFLQTYNMLSVTVQFLSEHDIGLWFPYSGFGFPYLAHPLSGMLYPPTMILAALNGRQHDLQFISFVMYLLSAKALAGVFFYLLMRDLDINRWGAFAGALVWAFNTRFDDTVRAAGAAHTLIWLPLLILVLRRLLEMPDKKYIACFSLIFAAAFFANYPPHFFYSMAFLFLFILFYPLDKPIGFSAHEVRPVLFRLGAAFSLGTGLTAIQLLPALELAHYWNRSGGLTFKEVFIYPCTLAQMVFGYIFPSVAYTERDHYAGLIPLILAAVGLFSKDSRYRFKALLVAVFVSTAVYSTRSVFSYPLQKFAFEYVPLFGGMRCPGRSLILNMLSLSMLAAYGLDRLTTLRQIPKNLWLMLTVSVAALLLAAVAIWLRPVISPAANRFDFVVLAVVSSLVVAPRFFSWKGNRQRLIFGVLVLAVIAGDLYWAGYRKNTSPREGITYYSRSDPRIESSRSLVSRHFNERFFWLPPKELERVPRLDHVLFQPLQHLNSLLPSPVPPFEKLGYEGSLMDVSSFFIKTRENRRVRSIMNTRFDAEYFLPRAYVVYHLERAKRDQIIDQMLSSEFDPLYMHYIEDDIPALFQALTKEIPEDSKNETERLKEIARETEVKEYGNASVTIVTDIPEKGFLFLSDAYFPGWHAYIDGKPARILRADYIFRGVFVPEGKHTVVFSYEPRLFYVGAGVALLSFAVVVALLVIDGAGAMAVIVLLAGLFCYGPLALSFSSQKQLQKVSPYDIQSIQGLAAETTRSTDGSFVSYVHADEAGLYDLLLKDPPQAYRLYADDEFVTNVFNTGSESPAPEKDVWEVQAVLKLGKGIHRIKFLPLTARHGMEPVYNRLDINPAKAGRYRVTPIIINKQFIITDVKLVKH